MPIYRHSSGRASIRSSKLLCTFISSATVISLQYVILIDESIADRARALILASRSGGELWLFYLTYASMAVLGAGTIPVTWTRAVTATFFHQRGLALGIMLSGTGICAILIPQYTVWLVENFGWRTAYLGLAALPLCFAAPLVSLFFHPARVEPEEPEERAEAEAGLTLVEAAAGYRFWVLLISTRWMR